MPRPTNFVDTIRQKFDEPDSSLGLIRRLFSENAYEYRKTYALAFVCMGLVAICTALSAWIMRDVINEIFVERNAGIVWVIASIVFAIFVVKGVSSYGHAVLLSRIGNNIIARNQKRVYDHVLAQGLDFYHDHPMSDLVTRMSRNVQSARDVLNMVAVSLGRDLLSLIGLICVMVLTEPILAAVALLIMPPAILGVAALIRRVRSVAKQEIVSQARIIQGIQETSLGVRVIKAFNLQAHLRANVQDAIEDVEMRSNRIATINARTSPLMETLGGLAVAVVIMYAGYSVLGLGRDPGSFFAFITALLMAYEPAKRLARLNIQLEASLVGVRYMYEILDTSVTLADKPDSVPMKVSDGQIVFDNVSFAYGEEAVLHRVSLEAKPGDVTALVGSSGAGKTTILMLIERFYRPESGSIRIDDQDIQDVTEASLRQQIAFVTQDTFLFRGTIGENIAMGRTGAGEADIYKAAKDANAHGFISDLPAGYDTLLEQGEAGLSGGQKQRISIARALLRDAPILLLDEATSALDTESELLVRQALDRLMVGRTTMVIAHRLSTIRRANTIYVMDKGRIIESGNHADLVAADGIYARLNALQFSDPADAA